MATEFEQVLMRRDNMSREEAKRERKRAREEFYRMMDECASYDEVEDMLAGDYGLEMDYIMDLI